MEKDQDVFKKWLSQFNIAIDWNKRRKLATQEFDKAIERQRKLQMKDSLEDIKKLE
jgi:hypothetical protein